MAKRAKRLASGVAVVCLGNPLRGDDAFGYLVYRLLRSAGFPALYAGAAPENVIGKLSGWKPRIVVIVDALLGVKPGISVVKLSETVTPLASTTHSVPLELLLKAAGVDPERVFVVGVGAERLGLGDEPSERVRGAAGEAARLLAKVLATGSLPSERELGDEGAVVAGDVEDSANTREL